MPVVDMPLEKLKKYTGTNPIPEDFDAFWDERMKEVENHRLNYSIDSSEINGFKSCSYYDLWFEGINGEKVYVTAQISINDIIEIETEKGFNLKCSFDHPILFSIPFGVPTKAISLPAIFCLMVFAIAIAG